MKPSVGFALGVSLVAMPSPAPAQGLELEGRPPITVKAGEAMVEPPDLKMTGYNRSAREPLRVLIVYTSDPDTQFLDLAATPR